MTPSPEPPRSSTVDSTSTPLSVARFEFSDLGTKVLMVEWHPGPSSAPASASSSACSFTTTTTTTSIHTSSSSSSTTTTDDSVSAEAAKDVHLTTPSSDSIAQPYTGLEAAAWEVSWPGKSTFLPARETDYDETGPRRRVYFLLPPEASIPTQVTITPPGSAKILVKPLPAIFPPGFNVEAGTRGVLHTLWAKKRLSELRREMEAEMRANAESVGLEMAMAERDWIVENFLRSPSSDATAPMTMSPRSPVSGRLGDKLKGLRLATSPADLVPSPTANTFIGTDIPSRTLSPRGDDVAVSSFVSMSHGLKHAEPMSLDAAIRCEPAPPVLTNVSSRDGEDELFALPLSPRSPDMKRGPFSALAI